MAAYTGHQNAHRNSTKDLLLTFGHKHAPLDVPPPGNKCEFCGQATMLTVPTWRGRLCAICEHNIARDEWQSVLDLVDGDKHEDTLGFDPTCGMQPKAKWAYDFLMLIFEEWLKLELETAIQGYSLDFLVRVNLEQSGFDAAAHTYLTSIGVHRLHSKSKSVVPGQMDWFAMSVYDYFARWRYPVKFTAPARPQVAPQILQSREDVMEQIAMSKAPIDPRKVDELVEAVQFSVEHWENIDARRLPDGYVLYQNPNGVYIYLKHPDHANRVAVGMVDPVRRLMEFVSKRGEIREYMLKVMKAGEFQQAAA